MMNSDSASSERFVLQSIALACRTYWDFFSRSRLLAAWMSPDVSSIMKIDPAPSPDRMYLTEPLPLSALEWSCECEMKASEGGSSPTSLQYRVITKCQDEWSVNGEEQAMRGTAIQSRTEKHERWRMACCTKGSLAETNYCDRKWKNTFDDVRSILRRMYQRAN